MLTMVEPSLICTNSPHEKFTWPFYLFTLYLGPVVKLHRVSSSLASIPASARAFQIHRVHVGDSPTVVQPFMQDAN
jgi:hypothetical protein